MIRILYPPIMKQFMFGIFLVSLISCDVKNQEKFSLQGTTQDIKDGSTLYLIHEDKPIDSATVNDNTFRFETELTDAPLKVILSKKDFSQYRFLWLEDRPMVFDASATDFSRAQVIGSKEENLSQALDKKTEPIDRSKRAPVQQEFIKNNPNSLNSAYILSVYSTTWGKETTQGLFENFPEDIKQSSYGKEIAKYIELNQNPAIGDSYIDFEMEDPEGNLKKLSDIDEKLILLEFWASNCGPCRKEHPNLIKTYEKFHPKGFEIFAVSHDADKKKWLDAIEEDHLPWPQVSELTGDANSAGLIYGVNGIPDNFLINAEGTIIERNLRGENLYDTLNELLN